jgi:hypothetical protein
MTKGDLLVERGADRVQDWARQLAPKGGVWAKVSDELAEDAVFLRKLKPSLIKARAKGQAPTNEAPGTRPAAPTAPQIAEKRPKKASKNGSGGGPNPFVVAGAALAAGIVLAKVIDWRGHAHPRD